MDGLVTLRQIEDSRILLSSDTMFIETEGGNHSQFGSYGFQTGDKTATISPEEQWEQIGNATVGFLDKLSEQCLARYSFEIK